MQMRLRTSRNAAQETVRLVENVIAANRSSAQRHEQRKKERKGGKLGRRGLLESIECISI